MMLALGLSYITFIMLRNVPSIPSFFRAFITKGVVFFQRLFLQLLRGSWGFCSCFCLYAILHYGFTYVEPSLHPWNETNLVMVYDFFWHVARFCLPVFCWESLHLY
jgi:hypothetical protein